MHFRTNNSSNWNYWRFGLVNLVNLMDEMCSFCKPDRLVFKAVYQVLPEGVASPGWNACLIHVHEAIIRCIDEGKQVFGPESCCAAEVTIIKAPNV